MVGVGIVVETDRSLSGREPETEFKWGRIPSISLQALYVYISKAASPRDTSPSKTGVRVQSLD